MPQLNKPWSRMTQEERETALLAQAAQHRKNHPAGRDRVEEDTDAAPELYRQRRKYERRQKNVQKDHRPGAGLLTAGWIVGLVATQMGAGFVTALMLGFGLYAAIRVLRARRVGRVGQVFSWLLIGQMAWGLLMTAVLAAVPVMHVVGAVMLPHPVWN